MSAPVIVPSATGRRPSSLRPTSERAHRRSRRAVGGPRKRRSLLLTIGMGIVVVYTLLPLVWLVINATKTQADLFSTFGLWFGGEFALFDNIGRVLAYGDGIFLRWLLNTLLYVVVGAGGATLLATLGGYAIAKFRFRGRTAAIAVVLGAVAIPGTALAVPTFLMFARLGITDTPWAVILPSLISPFGLYLMWVFASESIPDELIEAARVDGASELRIFGSVCLPLLGPGIVTVLLFTTVATWNNYFLPLIMLRNPDWYPLTIGLNAWNNQATTAGGDAIFDLVITGSLLAIIPLIALFLLLQRFWQSGLAAGSVKE
ncbi:MULTISPECIES: carbohydrate ABC transporter permease [unclassified Agrococcus]|uniref:carbohydrate ABC transporter permease n=1 Tax=unclassified Agrococcus TaxID=2615065 RepID=UPI00361E7906